MIRNLYSKYTLVSIFPLRLFVCFQKRALVPHTRMACTPSAPPEDGGAPKPTKDDIKDGDDGTEEVVDLIIASFAKVGCPHRIFYDFFMALQLYVCTVGCVGFQNNEGWEVSCAEILCSQQVISACMYVNPNSGCKKLPDWYDV